MITDSLDYLEPLNPRQREAVLHTGSPLLILAGAGSGKTRVITTKIAYLIDHEGVDPQSILAVTFTNKAAQEMYHRVNTLIEGAGEVLIRTFHSFGAWFLRRNCTLAGLSRNFCIYDDEDMLSLLQSIYPGKQKKFLKQYAHWISRAKDYSIGAEDDYSTITYDDRFGEIYSAYQTRLEEIGNADFGDLIQKPVTLLKENPELKRRIHQRFRVVLVDEYQDSNVAQFHLLHELFGDSTYLCVVGDDDQSIYRFRGAEVQNIIRFPEIFPGTQIVRLEQNYRSTQNILSIASAVVENNSGRLGKTLWTSNPEGKKAVFRLLEDQREEAAFCAELLMDGNLRDTAILYRTNAQSREFEIFFSRHNIPYKIVGAVSFYTREEVKDALALLHVISNPADEVAFSRIINKPSRGIGKTTLRKIIETSHRGKGSMFEGAREAAASMGSKSRKGVNGFLHVMDELEVLLENGTLSNFVLHAVKQTGLLAYHQGQDANAGTQKVRNLEELVSAAGDYPRGREGLSQFLEDIELDRARIEEEQRFDDDRVTLITMHNTKGLEFSRVIITGLEDGLFPGRRDSLDEDIEEERRIFYVSITRAKDELYLTSCRRRRIWGKTQVMYPSPFLDEIPGSLFQRDPDTGAEAPEYSPGTRIFHEEYGPGTVAKGWYNGSEFSIEVVFDSGRTAKFLPEYTPLERIAQDDF